MTNTIDITPAYFKGFVEAYDKAQQSDAQSFTYEGNEFDTGYAKYLIEYIGTRFSDGHEH